MIMLAEVNETGSLKSELSLSVYTKAKICLVLRSMPVQGLSGLLLIR